MPGQTCPPLPPLTEVPPVPAMRGSMSMPMGITSFSPGSKLCSNSTSVGASTTRTTHSPGRSLGSPYAATVRLRTHRSVPPPRGGRGAAGLTIAPKPSPTPQVIREARSALDGPPEAHKRRLGPPPRARRRYRRAELHEQPRRRAITRPRRSACGASTAAGRSSDRSRSGSPRGPDPAGRSAAAPEGHTSPHPRRTRRGSGGDKVPLN